MFGTMKNTRQMNSHGIGLGLFICKKIVNEFQGDIRVNSEYGKGSTFMFYFEFEDRQQANNMQDRESMDMEITERFEEMHYHRQHSMQFSPNARPVLIRNNGDDLMIETERRIMVVDDEVFNTVAIQGLMRVLGFT
jgi:hypothetical protein